MNSSLRRPRMRRGPSRGRQRGQAMIEYFVVLAFAVILLIKPLSATEPLSAVDLLAQSVRDYHGFYTFANAVAYVPNCTYAFSFDQIRPSEGLGAALTSTFNLSGNIDRCLDVKNLQLPMPTDLAVTFSFDFVNNVAEEIGNIVKDEIKQALHDFLDPGAILSSFGFDFSDLSPF